MPWAANIEGTEVRLTDLRLSALLEIVEDGADTEAVVTQLIVAPLNDFPRAVKVAEACAKQAGVPDPQAWVTAQLDKSWLDFTKVFVEVEDDLPSVVVDGNPPLADGSSINT